MTAARKKSATATLRPTDSAADAGSGTFEGVLSAPSRDRDGDVLDPSGWKTPLPEQIPISVDHNMTVGGVVGSAQPYLDPAGNLCVRGVFANTEQGQRVRQLVAAGHLRGLSVEFLDNGDGTRDLLGGSVVYAPANIDAKVLSAKSAATNSTSTADGPTATVNVTELMQFVADVDALPGTAPTDLGGALQEVFEELVTLAPWLVPTDDTDDDPNDTGDEDGANESSDVEVANDLTAKALLAELVDFG